MNVIAILNHMGVYFKEEPIRELHRALERLNFQIVYPNDRDDLLKLIENNARLCGVIFDWDKYNLELCEEISKMNENLPLYAFANTYSTLDVSLNDLRLQISFFEYALGAAEDIANKIKQTTDEYINTILPPLTKALFKYVREGKYTFCTPGHMGGTAFQKSPVGSLFYDFFGPNTMKSDISISVSELGSLLDHSGPHKEAEQYIARVFNADRSYMVTNGTSTANKIVGMYSAPAGSTILIDRNCHKSLTHLMMMSDVTPIYFRPTRNAYGILGGIPQSEFYENMRIQELAQNIHKLIVHHNLPDLMYRAFEVLPTMVMTPYAAFQKELHGMTEEVYLDEMVGRINANMILPYPPGVPLVMPGEMITEESRPVLEFLQMLCEIGAHYPGFETDIHGAYRQADGRYTVKVLKEESKK